MRRRRNKPPNDSESFGKVGQELPQRQAGQPAPLQPSYELATSAATETSRSEEPETSSQSQESGPVGAKRARRSRRGGRRRNKSSRADVQPKADAQDEPELEGEQPNEEDADSSDDGGEDFGNQFAEAAGKMETETQPEFTSTPPAAPEPLAPDAKEKPSRGVVVLAIGLPGSGKTTWFKRRGVVPLSSDMLRNLLFDDITEQRYQGLVFSTLRSLLRARLIAKMPWNYVDASNLSPHERRQWIKMARSFGYDVHAVFFNVPIEVCLARNARRERRVDEEVIRRMSERLRPPSFKEGFSKIIVVKVKDAQKAIEQASHPPHLSIPPDELEAE